MQVLVAEDDLTSRTLLEVLLKDWGYEAVVTDDGREAIDLIDSGFLPPLALLDWMLPNTSGTDICRRLRDIDVQGHYTYIIFVTAKGRKEEVQEGFQAGADDYVTKPIDADILRYRIAAGERIIEYENTLHRYTHDLEVLARRRAEQLVQSERLSTIGQLSAGIAHEINNPVTFISGNLQVMQECWPATQTALQHFVENEPGDHRMRAELMLRETPKMIESMRGGTKRISTIVSGLNAYACRQTGVKRPVDAHAVIEDALQLCHNMLKYHVSVHREFHADPADIMAAPQQIQQVLVNLLVNAADALNRPGKTGDLTVKTENASDDKVRIVFSDSGPGLPERGVHKIWDPFFTTKKPGESTGLGLSIARGIVIEHGGDIHAANAPEGGAVFTITLPAARVLAGEEKE